MAIRLEHRIIAEALVAARRPDKCTFHFTAEILRMTVGPAQAQNGNEAGCTLCRLGGALFLQGPFDLFHRHEKIAAGTIGLLRPIGGVDARRAVERIDAKTGIVGKCGQAGGNRRRARLGIGVLLERRPGFLRLAQAVIGSRFRGQAEGPQQVVDLGHLAGIVGCDNDLGFGQMSHARHFPTDVPQFRSAEFRAVQQSAVSSMAADTVPNRSAVSRDLQYRPWQVKAG